MELTVDIPAVPDRVYPHITDPESRLHWIGPLVASRREGADQLVETYESRGQRVEVVQQIERRIPGELVAGHADGPGFTTGWSYRLAKHERATRLTATIDVSHATLLARLLAPLSKPSQRRRAHEDLMRLRSLVGQDD